MKVQTPKNIAEFKKIFCELQNSGFNYYRGQADYCWDIISGLARNKNIKDIDNLIKIEKKLNEQFEKKIIEETLDSLIPRINNFHSSWVLLMAAKHYGLPTRLLDFTNDKYSALEFAVTEIEYLNKDGALIIYSNVNNLQEDLSIMKEPFKNNYTKTFFIQAPSLYNACYKESKSERRKLIQGSKFLYRQTENIYQNLALDDEHTYNLTIIFIDKKIKLEIIQWLIDEQRMAYDLYAGKNVIDYYAANLKSKFNEIDDSNFKEFIDQDDKWKF